MAMLCYVLAALCLVYCVGVVATKAAGTKFYLIWLAGTALFGLFGFFVQKGLWMRLPIGLRAGIGVLAGVGIACLCGLLILIGSTFSAKGEQQLSYLIVLGAQMKPKRAQRRSGKTAVSGIYLPDGKSGDALRTVRRTGQQRAGQRGTGNV